MSKHKEEHATANGAVATKERESAPMAIDLSAPPFWQTLSRWPEWKDLLSMHSMKVEQFNEDGTMVLRVEMPGVDPDKDVQVTVDEGVLRVHAERSSSTKSEKKDQFHSEFTYGSFDRAVRLPAGADEDDIQASYRDGILEVRVPVDPGRASGRKVAISR